MQIDIIGVPIDLGADRRGVDMGPSAIRYAHLQQKLCVGKAIYVHPSLAIVTIHGYPCF